jgi:hypothetical protein
VALKYWEHLKVQMTGHHKASEKSQQSGHLSNHTPNKATNQGCSQNGEKNKVENVHKVQLTSALGLGR